MPLTKRAISPVNVSRHRLPPNVKREELECVANGTLANLVRQLSSLSKHAEDVFGELYHEAMKIEHRTNTLANRMDRLAMKVTKLDSNEDETTLQDISLRKPFKSNALIDQQSLSRQTLPTAMTDCYNRCDRPPDLDALNIYREDGRSGLKFYTDPDFFFDLWRQEMLKDMENHKKIKQPKPRTPNEINSVAASSHRKKRIRQPRDTREELVNRAIKRFPEEYQTPEFLRQAQAARAAAYGGMPQYAMQQPPPGMIRPQDFDNSNHVPPSTHLQQQQILTNGQYQQYSNNSSSGYGTDATSSSMHTNNSQQQQQQNMVYYNQQPQRAPPTPRLVQQDNQQSPQYYTPTKAGGYQQQQQQYNNYQPQMNNYATNVSVPYMDGSQTSSASTTPRPQTNGQTTPTPNNMMMNMMGAGQYPQSPSSDVSGGRSERRGSTPRDQRPSMAPPAPPLSLNGPSDQSSSIRAQFDSLQLIDDRSGSPDLPPPPPPLMSGSVMSTATEKLPSPPPVDRPATFLGGPQPSMANGKIPPAPPPPPPPSALVGQKTPLMKSIPQSSSKPAAPPAPDPRSDLLRAIREGIQLKKVDRLEEKEREQAAAQQGHDVAAILRKRMLDVMGRESDESEDEEANDEEWED